MSELVWIALFVNYMGFYFTWIGRGLFFILFGCLVLGRDGLPLAAAIVAFVMGAIYVLLGLLKVMYFPSPLVGGSDSSVYKSSYHHSKTTTVTSSSA